jgi:LysM repeat protein
MRQKISTHPLVHGLLAVVLLLGMTGMASAAMTPSNPQLGQASALAGAGQMSVLQQEPPQPGEGEQLYTVQLGDTLSGIAVRFGVTIEHLMERNPQIEEPGLIFAGQQIVVPAQPVDVIPYTGEGEQLYTVQRGDTLFGIAVRFGTTVEALVERNPHIVDPALIFPGQQLVVPLDPDEIIPDTGEGEQLYTVVRGDTLSGIAVRFGTTVDALMERNPHIVNPALIFPGQQIVVPDTPEDIIPDTGERLYTVQPGDTLSEIAVRFGTTVPALMERNPQIFDPNLIFPGQQLIVPDVPVTPTPTPPPDDIIPDTGALIFQDDFSGPRPWFRTVDPNFAIGYVNDTYRILNNFFHSYVSSVRTFNLANVYVETNAQQVAGPDSAYFGAVCRWQDVHNFYAFTITNDGVHRIVRVANGQVAFLAQGSGAAVDQNAANRIGGSCSGDTLALFLNGEQLLTAQDGTFARGHVGAMVGTHTGAGADIHFDSFEVRGP